MEHFSRGLPLSKIHRIRRKDNKDVNLWSWGPLKNETYPAQRAGYKDVAKTVGTIVQAALMSQLYDFDLVRRPDNHLYMHAQEEDIKRVAACPVILAHAINPPFEHDDILLLTPLPLEWHGSYALVDVGDKENLALYQIQQLPEAAYKRWNEAQWLLHNLVKRADETNSLGWALATSMHRMVADERSFRTTQQEIITKILATRDEKQREEFEQELEALLRLRNQVLYVDRLLQLSDYHIRYQEIARMMQQIAQDYLDFHNSQVAAQKNAKKDAPPVNLGIFDGKLIAPTNQPFIAAMQAVQDAASGAKKWQEKENQPPYFARRTTNNMTIIEYGRTSEQETFEDKAIKRLWQDVKGFSSPEEQIEGFSDRDGDLLLYIFSAAIKETNGQGSVWIHAKHFMEQRGVQPITKKEGAVTRRAGDRTEDLAAVERAIYRLSGLWVTIEEIFPPRKKGGKRKVYRHQGRLFAVMETWRQDTLGENGVPQERLPVAWKVKAGDWLMEYLAGPRYTAWLCDQSLKYDPHNEVWEKRLSRYFIFFLRINAKHASSTLVRSIEELVDANSLPLDQENPQRARNRFEKAMNRLLEDKQIDGWEYVTESQTDLPSKKWLPFWLKWQVRIAVIARAEIPQSSSQG